MEESLEKRISLSELKGVEKLIRDPGTKQMARRIDRKGALEDEGEVLRFLEASKSFHSPLTYLAMRLAWSLSNLSTYIETLRNTRKELNSKLQEGDKVASKLREQITRTEHAMTDQKSMMDMVVQEKEREIEVHVFQLTNLGNQVERITGELETLRGIEEECRVLNVKNREVVEESEKMSQKAKDAMDEVCG